MYSKAGKLGHLNTIFADYNIIMVPVPIAGDYITTQLSRLEIQYSEAFENLNIFVQEFMMHQIMINVLASHIEDQTKRYYYADLEAYKKIKTKYGHKHDKDIMDMFLTLPAEDPLTKKRILHLKKLMHAKK